MYLATKDHQEKWCYLEHQDGTLIAKLFETPARCWRAMIAPGLYRIGRELQSSCNDRQAVIRFYR